MLLYIRAWFVIGYVRVIPIWLMKACQSSRKAWSVIVRHRRNVPRPYIHHALRLYNHAVRPYEMRPYYAVRQALIHMEYI